MRFGRSNIKEAELMPEQATNMGVDRIEPEDFAISMKTYALS